MNIENQNNAVPPKRSFVVRALSSLFRISMKLVLIAIFVGFGLLVGGFLKFSNIAVEQDASSKEQSAQAIVALTGGSKRVSQALDLLAEKKGERLLISGVNESVKMEQLRSMNSSRSALFDCCVDLEYVALNTIGNAVETKKWMAIHDYNSMFLVTSGYHMPRSLFEFRRQMPNVEIHPHPVVLEQFQSKDWWQDPQILKVMVSEYLKYVGALSRDFLNSKPMKVLRESLSGG